MSIPFVVKLWENVNFSGTRRTLVYSEPNLGRQLFDNKTSSVEIFKIYNGIGSNWVKLHRDMSYTDRFPLPLELGYRYRDLHGAVAFGDITSSVDVNPIMNPVDLVVSGTIRKTRLVKEMDVCLILKVFKEKNCNDSHPYAYVVENISSISEYLGSDFNDSIKSIYCEWGPSRRGNDKYKAVVYEHDNFQGNHMDITPEGGDFGIYRDLGNMKNKISSIKIIRD